VSEGKAEEALQSAVGNASQTLALGLGFGRFESWRETHETCKNAKMQIMQRATRVKARPVSRLAGMGAKSYISVSGDRQSRCWLLAAGCCYEVVLAPAVSVRHTIPHLTRALDTGDPALSRETSPQILSDVDDDGECKINPSLGLPNLACLTGQSQTPTANRNLRVSRPNGNLWVGWRAWL
jgi:hypothetical protein